MIFQSALYGLCMCSHHLPHLCMLCCVRVVTCKSLLPGHISFWGSRHISLALSQIDPAVCTTGTSNPKSPQLDLTLCLFHYSSPSPHCVLLLFPNLIQPVNLSSRSPIWAISLSFSLLSYKLKIHSQLLPLCHIPSLIKNLGLYSLNIFKLGF